ncbi:MAG: class I tRNA ligase family protein [Chloroflexi bacterium]|nr:class I tRNA ligase family protein [Chloroflexota bacterium]
MFNPVSSKPNFPELELEILRWWKETDAFGKLRRLRAGGPRWSFLDGPITANNPMGVHHAWGRTYKDLFQRFRAMRGFDERWQNGFDCQGLWVEVNVEKDLGFQNKRDIEKYGLAEFVMLCKQRVLNFAAVQTEQSIRLGMWMDWNDPDQLRWLAESLGEDSQRVISVKGPDGPYSNTVEQVVGHLGMPELGGSYFTFSNENNYDIWAFLKKCFERDWIYKGTDVMPWCGRCGTAVSEHEISTEDYPDLTHTSVTARFPLVGRPKEYLLVWTTMPWTFIPHIMVAANPDLTYVKVRQGDATYYLLENAAPRMLKGPYETLGRLTGREMLGWQYVGPFDELPAEQEVGGHVAPELRPHIWKTDLSAAQAHRVVLWKDVTETEGTGLVHMGTGAGPEDFRLGRENGMPVVAPLDENGVFMEGFGPFTGMGAFEVTQKVVESLEQKGMLYRVEPYTHRYPTCWRCKTPLVFRLVDEWFIRMGPVYDKPREELTPEEKAHSLRYQIMDVVDQIRWIPGFGYEREMDWLRNMHDWMISKKRYWGLALPIWECSDCGQFEVIGSEEELRERAVEGWDKFAGHTPHRPYIDEVKIACKCGGLASRIKDVGNPWLDAGIAPFSTVRYRSDPAYWKKWFPADFVTESFPGQFRNWFYSMLAMSTVMVNRPPFQSLMGYGTLVAEDGRPMHKSLGNMIEFNEAAEAVGVDVMRWEFASQRYESNMLFGYHTADDARRHFILPLWNVYSFLVTYANLDQWTPDLPPFPIAERRATVRSGNLLDLWIVSRLQQIISEVTAALEDYDAPSAARTIEPFVDDLSNWYLRRSRRRFWKSEADEDKRAAYATLHEVLVTLSKLLAPFIPFLAEAVYQNLVRSVDLTAPESVHHTYWPKFDAAKMDEQVVADMAVAREVVTLGHSIRAAKSIKVRQPLGRAVVVADLATRAALDRMRELVADELNVKSVQFAQREDELVSYQLRPNLATLSQKVKQLVPEVSNAEDKAQKKALREKRQRLTSGVQSALANLDPARVAADIREGRSISLKVDTTHFELGPEDILVQPQPRPGFAVASQGNLVVALDTEITSDLAAEGLAREFVRHVQDLRKATGLDISDRIRIYHAATPKLAHAIEDFRAYIMGETLAEEMSAGPGPAGSSSDEDTFDGEHLTLSLTKVK